MRAFEKHWDYTGLSEHVNYHPDPEGPKCIRVPGINRKEERREGWKAALEWFGEKLIHYTVEDAVYFLEQELEKEELEQ